MEELFDQLIDAVAEHLSGIADSDALDALMEKSSDLIQERIISTLEISLAGAFTK